MNFSFDNKGTKTLAVEIIENVMDELRRERKIAMVLADAEIEEYIKLDLGMGQSENDENISPFMKKVLIEKRMFREQLCQKVSILRLGYMFKVLKQVHPGKATMLGAEAFLVKMKKLENKENKRKRFAVGAGNISGVSGAGKGNGNQSMDSAAIRNKIKSMNIVDPILQGINEFIKKIKDDIVAAGNTRLKTIEGLYSNFKTQKSTVGGGYMDTVEENLKGLEMNRPGLNNQSTLM